jgi:hypothetical protein
MGPFRIFSEGTDKKTIMDIFFVVALQSAFGGRAPSKGWLDLKKILMELPFFIQKQRNPSYGAHRK